MWAGLEMALHSLSILFTFFIQVCMLVWVCPFCSNGRDARGNTQDSWELVLNWDSTFALPYWPKQTIRLSQDLKDGETDCLFSD